MARDALCLISDFLFLQLFADATSAADAPFGEPHDRHIVYDLANKHIFVANRAMNRVEVSSTASQMRIAQISVPAASSADLCFDSPGCHVLSRRKRLVRQRVFRRLLVHHCSRCPAKISVKVGATAATVQRVENVTSIASALGLDSSYPFPLERITLQTPSGSAGKADILVSSPAGSTTSQKSFQYLQGVHSYSKPALFKFLIYDQARQRIDLTNIDHVDVFDLQQNLFLAPIQPPGGPPPNAGLRGLTLTPDGSQRVVADFGAQKVYLLDPVKGTGSTVFVCGVSGFTNSGLARVTATSTQGVFVGLSGEGGSSGACSTCLAQMNLTVSPPTIQTAPQPEVTRLTGAPLIQSNAAGDQVFSRVRFRPRRSSRILERQLSQSFRYVFRKCLRRGLGNRR